LSKDAHNLSSFLYAPQKQKQGKKHLSILTLEELVSLHFYRSILLFVERKKKNNNFFAPFCFLDFTCVDVVIDFQCLEKLFFDSEPELNTRKITTINTHTHTHIQ
jgi:hypothetical protein